MAVLIAISKAEFVLAMFGMSVWGGMDTNSEISSAHQNARNSCRSNKRLLSMKDVLQNILNGDDITLNRLEQLIIDWDIYATDLRDELSITRESYRNRLILLVGMVSLVIVALTAMIYRRM